MRFRFHLALLATCLGSRAALAGDSIGYVSQPGDYVGQGQTRLYTDADGTFFDSTYGDAGVHIQFQHATNPDIWWDVDLVAPQWARLTQGTYDNATRYPFQDLSAPGFEFMGSGGGCNELSGSFSISDVLYDWFGNIVLLAATLTQHCDGAVPALLGSVNHQGGTIGPMSFGSQDVLVTYQNEVLDFARDGTLVQRVPILGGDETPGPTEVARDLVRDSSGRVHVFNGTVDPVLSTLSPTSGEWTERTQNGWTTLNGPSYGGIAALGSLIFVSDMASAGNPAVGMIRFDANQVLPTVHFAGAYPYIDVAAGLDGKIYGLRDDGKHVDAFDPETLAPHGSATLAATVDAIAVDGTGRIFAAAENQLYRFDSTGVIQTNLSPGVYNFGDIDLSASGAIVAGSKDGYVVLSDTTLASSTSFPVDRNPVDMAFVAFAETPLDPNPLFHDGFESGDTNAWTLTQP